jgi:hypothetical protein
MVVVERRLPARAEIGWYVPDRGLIDSFVAQRQTKNPPKRVLCDG